MTVTVAKHPSSLTLSGPTTGIAGKPLAFSGALNPGGPQPPAGASITVLRTVSNRKGTFTDTLPAVVTVGDGSFSFADNPPVSGQYTYTVQWAGDDAFLSAQASHDVSVQGSSGNRHRERSRSDDVSARAVPGGHAAWVHVGVVKRFLEWTEDVTSMKEQPSAALGGLQVW